MTTAKELNLVLQNGVKFVGEDEVYDLKDVIREEGDFDLGDMGVLKWVTAVRDPDEPGDYMVLFEHEGLLYAIYGSYDSWHGVEFYDTDLHPVKKVEKTIVVYRARNES